jgi:SAM-dependent methyltransferase
MTSQSNSPSRPDPAISQHQLNKTWWNEVTPVHAASEFYDVKGFLAGASALDPLELEGLGDVAGKSVLHLQCHFGMSTIEIARRGAAKVVGVDLSDISIRTAEDLARQAGLDDRTGFVCCDVLELDKHLSGQFDIVFTSYGVITWLCDLMKWGEIVAHFLKPGGRFFILEIHPALMMFDWQEGEIRRLFGYFHGSEGFISTGDADYADNSYLPKHNAIEWQWSFADVFHALTRAGLTLGEFNEYPYCCFAPFPNMIQRGQFYYLPDSEKDIPMLFSLQARKESGFWTLGFRRLQPSSRMTE